MAKYNFTANSNQLIVTLVVTDGDFKTEQRTYMGPSIIYANDKIKIYEFGKYKTAFLFTQIGEIASVEPTSMQDAVDKLTALIGELNQPAA